MDDDVSHCVLQALLCSLDHESADEWRARCVCRLWKTEIDDRLDLEFKAYASAVFCAPNARRAYVVSRFNGSPNRHVIYTCSCCRSRKFQLGDFSCCRKRYYGTRGALTCFVAISVATLGWLPRVLCILCHVATVSTSIYVHWLETRLFKCVS
mgnify:CR=1 FL=1